MGLDKTAAEVLCAAKQLGADFSQPVMIGRQWLSAPQRTLDEIATLAGASAEGVAGSRFAEPFFAMLGARSVDSVDVSDYEGATLVHDMNLPLPAVLRQRYSVVFDGGSLEHVFNIPQALRNCMEMLRVGGFFVQVNNGNNFMGHGFWQFSPELLYRVFSPENGFETLAVLLQEHHQPWRTTVAGNYHYARDPKQLGWRVELRNSRPTYIITIARRVSDVPIFASLPQQSDYQSLWSTGELGAGAKPSWRSRAVAAIRQIVPPPVERALRSTYGNKAYVPVSRAALMAGRLPSSIDRSVEQVS